MVELVPATLLFVAAEVGKGVAGEAGKSLWTGMVAAYERWRGVPPVPADITEDAAQALVRTPGLASLAAAYYADAPALRRATLVAPALRGAKILWVDDLPEQNVSERRTLAELGCVVTSVESKRSALACLRADAFDVILSDIDRGEDAPTAGLDALPELRTASGFAPVIFYVGAVDGGVPPGAFGITADPTELLHLCMDALEWRRV